jgi:hypothetical protein
MREKENGNFQKMKKLILTISGIATFDKNIQKGFTVLITI